MSVVAVALYKKQLGDERFGHLRGDGVFEAERVGESLIELSRPGARALAHVEQLQRNADALARAFDAPVKHEIDAKLAPGVERVRVFAAVAQDGTCRAHGKAMNIAQACDQRVS